QVRLARLLELRLEPFGLCVVAGAIVDAADELEAQEDEIGVQRVRLAVVADARELAAPPCLPHAAAAHAELAGQAAKLRDELERRAPGALISGQHVHQVQVPPMEAV